MKKPRAPEINQMHGVEAVDSPRGGNAAKVVVLDTETGEEPAQHAGQRTVQERIDQP